MTVQSEFLVKAAAAARAAEHIFPEMAACEAALESGWGHSKLAEEANNLFGQKQSEERRAGSGTVSMPTREFVRGMWVTVAAEWVMYANWQACFAGRMALLRTLSGQYASYAAALRARTAEEFVHLVSERWSTDPQRAAKVLEIYDAHRDALESRLAMA